MEPIKVYVVKVAFEHEGLAYAEGEKYELADSVVSTLPECTVEEFIETPVTAPEVPVEEPNKEAPQAKPWAGGHTVGR